MPGNKAITCTYTKTVTITTDIMQQSLQLYGFFHNFLDFEGLIHENKDE